MDGAAGMTTMDFEEWADHLGIHYDDEIIGPMRLAWDRATKIEREACAQEAERQMEDEPYGHAKFRCANIAAAIRGRSSLADQSSLPASSCESGEK